MKLIIQIPCLDEEEQLPATLADLPRHVDGFDEVEWLVVDDGSTDRTVDAARAGGVDHIVRLTNHKGLATAFQAGLDAALKLGADVVVNTDADNQYAAADIATIVGPIVEGRADMVIGDRQVLELATFSWPKRRLQWLGSWVVRRGGGPAGADATSGFRAYNREAALGLVVTSRFTYTLESLIQAGRNFVAVDHVPVRTNRATRPSRLFTSNVAYIRRSVPLIFRLYAFHEPLKVFSMGAFVLALAAALAWTPFLLDWLLTGDRSGHLQSILLGGVLMVAAVQVFALGVLADLLGNQRTMTERTLARVRRLELALGVEPSHYEPGDDGARPGAAASPAGTTRRDAPGPGGVADGRRLGPDPPGGRPVG